MADIPALSDLIKRKLAVLWDSLRDSQKLTDEEISGYDLGRQWLLGIFDQPPRGMNLGGFNALNRRRTAGFLGLGPSVKVAEGRFRATDWEYWSHWCSSGEPYQTYAAWLETLKRDTVAELESIWKGRSAVTDRWFEETCKPAMEKALADIVKLRIAQARDVEVQRLQRNPQRNPILTGEASQKTSDWPNLSPEDPRYKPWQLIIGVLQRDQSNANGNFIANFKARGAENAVLTLVDQKYDACGQVGMMLAENVAKAQDVAEILTEVVEPTLAAFGPMFQVCEQHGMSADALLTQARIRLMARMEHWKAKVFERGLKGELHALKKCSTETTPDNLQEADDDTEPSGTESADAAGAAEAERRRAAIDGFMAAVAEKTGRKITRKDIWTVAGYKDPTEFERFQRDNPRTTKSATIAFNRILRMTPANFVEMLDKKSAPQ